jgi:tetratricopeptide (TPR) repeat protein
MARELLLPGWDDPKANTRHLVSGWLRDEKNGNWLMVLDNVDDSNVFFGSGANMSSGEDDSTQSNTPLFTYLPQSSNGSILVTSRNREAALKLTTNGQNIINVHPMGEEDARALLRKKLPDDRSSEEDCIGLVQALEQLPLAITQAAAYISNKYLTMTISKYLKFFQKEENQARLLQDDMGDLRRDSSIPSSVIATWQISFNQIKNDSSRASELLSLMCVLDRQGIPEFLLNDHDSLDFQDDLGVLTGFSFITIEADHNFGMHRLVQLATRKWLELQHSEKEWQEKALGLLAEKFPTGEYKYWEICQMLLPHAQAVIGYNFSTETYLLRRARLLRKLARYDLTCGRYSISYTRCKEALDIYEAALRPEHSDILASINDIGEVLWYQGKYKEAEEMLRRALEGKEKALGEENVDTLTSVDSLALVLRARGKYEEAEKMLRRALEKKEKALRKENVDTLTSASHLALVLQDQEKYEEAEKINRRALAGRERVLTMEHPNTLISVNNLALVLQGQGKYEKAEEMNRRALAGNEKILGMEHPETLNSVNNLAVVLQKQGKYEKAEEMNRRALAGNEKILGMEHPDTLISVNNLAIVLQKQGKYEKAEEMNRRALAGNEKILEMEHPDTFRSVNNLAVMLRDQGKYEKAEEMNRRALTGNEKILGMEHPDTLRSVINLAVMLQDQGNMRRRRK